MKADSVEREIVTTHRLFNYDCVDDGGANMISGSQIMLPLGAEFRCDWGKYVVVERVNKPEIKDDVRIANGPGGRVKMIMRYETYTVICNRIGKPNW